MSPMTTDDNPRKYRRPKAEAFQLRDPDTTKSVLAIDPGEKRTGLALYDPDIDTITTFSRDPWDEVGYVERSITTLNVIVIENWVSYPHAQAGNAWRELLEVRIIGALEWVCKQHGIEPVFQSTNILIPARAIAKAQGYQWVGDNRDELAAEAHLYHYRHLREDTQ